MSTDSSKALVILTPNFTDKKKIYWTDSVWQTSLFPTKEMNLNPTKFN